MEITDVEAIPLRYDLGERSLGNARGAGGERATTLVRLETDDGTVGWGEAFAPAETVATAVEELLADRVLGMDPFDAEGFVERSYAEGYHFARGPFVRAGVAGLDIACWDLMGKATGRPVHDLLGGDSADELTPYASTGYFTGFREDIADPIEDAVADGFTAAKIKIGESVESDVERVRTARDILGDDAHLMVDYNGNYRPTQAIQSAAALEPFDLTWLEEPVPPENPGGYRRVAEQVDVPLAAGEAHFSRFEFADLVDVVDVVQPNLSHVGLTDAQFVARTATTRNVAVRPHFWNGGVGLAAAVHFAASVPDYPHSMRVPEPLLFEFDRGENLLREDLLETPFDPTGGSLAVPDDPGLGIEVDEAAVERYRV